MGEIREEGTGKLIGRGTKQNASKTPEDNKSFNKKRFIPGTGGTYISYILRGKGRKGANMGEGLLND